MSETALQIVLHLAMVVEGVAAALLFSAFGQAKNKKKTLLFAGIIILTRIGLSFLPFDTNYIASAVTILVLYGASYLFSLRLQTRVFLVCCFWSAKEICLFTSLGPRTFVNSLGYSVMSHMVMNDPTISLEDIRQYSKVSLAISETIFTVVYSALLITILRYIAKSFIYKNTAMQKAEMLYLMLPCLTGIAVTQLLRYVFRLPVETASVILNSTPLMGFLIPLAGVLSLLGMAASVRLYRNLRLLQAEETSKKVLEKQMTQIKEQVTDVQAVYADIRGIRHDMANHLSNIRLLVQSGAENREELQDYIGKLEGNLDALRLDYQTGSPITDVILHAKMKDAKDRGIAFDTDFIFPDALNIDSVDIAVILSNALDNALDACAAVPEGKRFVRLCAYQKGAMFFIETENSFCGNLRFNESTGLPESGKSDTQEHGIGLENIKRCAGKYFGDINIAARDGVFRLTVMLQGRE